MYIKMFKLALYNQRFKNIEEMLREFIFLGYVTIYFCSSI